MPEEIEERLAEDDEGTIRELAEERGVFQNRHTLEVDLFRNGFADPMIETLREVGFGAERSARIDALAQDPENGDPGDLLGLIDAVGKGRFAQRLAPRIVGQDPPEYLAQAIAFVRDRV